MQRHESRTARRLRRFAVTVAAAVGVVAAAGLHPIAAAGSGATPVSPSASSSYRSPVASTLVVVNAFDAVADPYAPGHRGVDLALADGAPVLAAAAGVVRYAGLVAGRGLVVVQHPDGIATEYEPLSFTVRLGQTVLGGQRLGTLAGTHAGCARNCVHWGARRDGAYFDPLSLLRPLGIVRLLPCECLPDS